MTLYDLMQQRYSTAATGIKSREIQRILIEVASCEVMSKSNADKSNTLGSHHGKAAGVKIDFGFDLLTESIVPHRIKHRGLKLTRMGENTQCTG